jgi:hypothetical protein
MRFTGSPFRLRLRGFCYLCQQLHLLPLMSVHVDAEKTLYRYRQVIRTYLDIKPYTYCISRRNFFSGKQLRVL